MPRIDRCLSTEKPWRISQKWQRQQCWNTQHPVQVCFYWRQPEQPAPQRRQPIPQHGQYGGQPKRSLQASSESLTEQSHWTRHNTSLYTEDRRKGTRSSLNINLQTIAGYWTCAIWLEGSVGGSYLQERRKTPACELPTSLSYFNHLQGSGAHRPVQRDETFWSSPHPKWWSTWIQEDALMWESNPSHCARHRQEFGPWGPGRCNSAWLLQGFRQNSSPTLAALATILWSKQQDPEIDTVLLDRQKPASGTRRYTIILCSCSIWSTPKVLP